MDPSALYPLRATHEIPAVSADEMREIERLAVDDAGLSTLQMMENAGRALAVVVRDHAGPPDPYAPRRVLVVAGRDDNGGGALAAARHLRNWGYDPRIALAGPPGQLHATTAAQHRILHRDGVRATWPGAPDFDERFPAMLVEAETVVDGLTGYTLRGPVQGDAALIVDAILEQAPPVVISLDVPSGVEAASGDVYATAIVASTTLCLALPKAGLIEGDAAAAVGDLLLADVGIPQYIYERLELPVAPNLFAEGPILRLISDA